VVVVTRTETDFTRSDATRVAWTCMVAGVQDVAVLDGGYNKWAKDRKPVSTDAPKVQSITYAGTIDRSTVVGKSYVLSKIGTSTLLDTRKPEDYFGKTAKPGHIRNAINLPTPWIFTDDGTYIEEQELRAMAEGVLGTKKSKEIIVYCGVGGFASTWWFVLTQILGYQNVKLYDGSMEEWLKDPEAPVSTYTWH
jgi:thiosulfate/3-mercaptopyruvate sulfurtransferase